MQKADNILDTFYPRPRLSEGKHTFLMPISSLRHLCSFSSVNIEQSDKPLNVTQITCKARVV